MDKDDSQGEYPLRKVSTGTVRVPLFSQNIFLFHVKKYIAFTILKLSLLTNKVQIVVTKKHSIVTCK